MNIIVMNWVINNVPNICSPTQADNFTCPKATVFFNASIIWGVIGPQRIFAIVKIYSDTLWFFLLGALLPIPIWLWVRKRPEHWLRYIHVPLIMGGLGMIPPATPMNYISWALVKYHFLAVQKTDSVVSSSIFSSSEDGRDGGQSTILCWFAVPCFPVADRLTVCRPGHWSRNWDDVDIFRIRSAFISS